MLFTMVTNSHLILLSIWNVASVPEELNFFLFSYFIFYFNLVNYEAKHICVTSYSSLSHSKEIQSKIPRRGLKPWIILNPKHLYFSYIHTYLWKSLVYWLGTVGEYPNSQHHYSYASRSLLSKKCYLNKNTVIP